MSIWSPREMPKLRYHAIRAMGSDLRMRLEHLDNDREHNDPAALQKNHVHTLQNAELMWASDEMTQAAVVAGRALPDVCFTDQNRPAERGFIVFSRPRNTPVRIETPDGLVNRKSVAILTEDTMVHFPIDAVSWGPYLDGIHIWWWTEAKVLRDIAEQTSRGVMPGLEDVSIIPVDALVATKLDGQRTPIDALPDVHRWVLPTLHAAWNLMAQKGITEQSPVEVDRKIRKAYARENRPAPSVRLVDLRRRTYTNGTGSPGTDRTYRHRWITRGHWRDQPVGPGRTGIRRIWIPAHIKGPDGAPMIDGQKVQVWRR